MKCEQCVLLYRIFLILLCDKASHFRYQINLPHCLASLLRLLMPGSASRWFNDRILRTRACN